MSVKININIVKDQLLAEIKAIAEKLRQAQRDNRLDEAIAILTSSKKDQIDNANRFKAGKDKAVHEESVDTQTAATRKKPGFGGWLYVDRITEPTLITQYSVAPSTGNEWISYQWLDKEGEKVGVLEDFYQKLTYPTVIWRAIRYPITSNACITVQGGETIEDYLLCNRFVSDPSKIRIWEQNPYDPQNGIVGVALTEERRSNFFPEIRSAEIEYNIGTGRNVSEWNIYHVLPLNDEKAILSIKGNRMYYTASGASYRFEDGSEKFGLVGVFQLADPLAGYQIGDIGVAFHYYYEIPPEGIQRSPSAGISQGININAAGGGNRRYARFEVIYTHVREYVNPEGDVVYEEWWVGEGDEVTSLVKEKDMLKYCYGLDWPFNTTYSYNSDTKHIGFKIMPSKVKEISIPDSLKIKYNTRYPLYQYQSGTNSYTYPSTIPGYVYSKSNQDYLQQQVPLVHHMGAGQLRGPTWTHEGGSGMYTDEIMPQETIFGSPGIYDYLGIAAGDEESDKVFADDWAWANFPIFSQPFFVNSQFYKNLGNETGTPCFSTNGWVARSAFYFPLLINRRKDFEAFFGEKVYLSRLLWLTKTMRQEAVNNYQQLSDYINLFNNTGNTYNYSSILTIFPEDPNYLYSYLEQTQALYLGPTQPTGDGTLGDGIGWAAKRAYDQGRLDAGYMPQADPAYPVFTYPVDGQDVGASWTDLPKGTQLSGARILPPSLAIEYGFGPHPMLNPYYWTERKEVIGGSCTIGPPKDDYRAPAVNSTLAPSLIAWTAWYLDWTPLLVDKYGFDPDEIS